MNLKRDKKGQFYLAAAIVIIALLAGAAGVTNSLKKTEPVKIYNLKDELGIESGQVLDYGVYNGKDTDEMNSLLEDFTQNYAGYVEKGFSLYFVFGNAEEIVVAGYKDLLTGVISYSQGDSVSELEITQGEYNSEIIENPSEVVEVEIDSAKYNFELKQGNNFYFVIYQKTQGGTFVEKG